MNPNTNLLLVVGLLSVLALLTWLWLGPGASDPSQALIEGWRQAVGGESVQSVQSLYMRSRIKVGGLGGSLEEWFTSQGQHRQQLDLAGIYTTLTVFDGHLGQGWLVDTNDKLQALQGVDLEDEITDTYLGSYAHLRSGGLKGTVSFAGEDDTHYLLEIRPQNGRPITYYLDKTTLLPVKSQRAQSDQTLTTFFNDWRSVHGILMPFAIRQTTGDPEYDTVVTVQEVQVNPVIEPTAFLPPEITAQDHQFTNGQNVASVPFELNNNHIYLQARVNGSAPYWFILDTGADVSLIHPNVASEQGLEPQGALEGRGAGEGSVDVALVGGVSFSLPGVEVSDQTVAVVGLDELAAIEGRAIDGILGYDFLSRFAVEIDYEHHQLTLHEPKTYRYDGSGDVLPFTLEGNDPMVEATLAFGRTRISGKFLIDTGARSALVLGRPFVETHHLLDSISPLLSGPLGFGVGGATQRQIGRIDRLELGAFSLPQIITAFSQDEAGALANPERAGLIGGEVLRHFTVTFDYARQEMILKPNGQFNAPFEYNMSGLTLMAVGDAFDRIQVLHVLEGSPGAEAGVRQGDVLITIDGQPASGHTLEAIRQSFKEAGRSMTLVLQRGEQTFEAVLHLKRLI